MEKEPGRAAKLGMVLAEVINMAAGAMPEAKRESFLREVINGLEEFSVMPRSRGESGVNRSELTVLGGTEIDTRNPRHMALIPREIASMMYNPRTAMRMMRAFRTRLEELGGQKD